MVTLRQATPLDAEQLVAIYAPYVLHTAITFEYEVPSEAEFAERIAHTRERYPFFVAEEDGELLGYAYASQLGVRAAYGWSCEASIYLARDAHGRGLGRALYEALEGALASMGVVGIYACVACPTEEDEYLTNNSLHFHEHLGFVQAGRLHNCGHKFGRWYDTVWLEKEIGKRVPDQPTVRPYREG